MFNDFNSILSQQTSSHGVDMGIDSERMFFYLFGHLPSDWQASHHCSCLYFLSAEKQCGELDINEQNSFCDALKNMLECSEIKQMKCVNILIDCNGHISTICKHNEKLYSFDSNGEKSVHSFLLKKELTSMQVECLNEKNQQLDDSGKFDMGFCGFATLKFNMCIFQGLSVEEATKQTINFCNNLKDKIRTFNRDNIESFLRDELKIPQQRKGVQKGGIGGVCR